MVKDFVGYANSFGVNAPAGNIHAFNPQWWAQESVLILVENMVAANLVHRDFEQLFANAGDVVNTRKPGEFTAKRKGANDNVTIQDATATNIPVKLDQHVHTSFMIRDGEETKSFKDLTNEYLRPATISLARFVDQMVLAQVYQYLENQSGSVGGLTSSNAVSAITDARNVMNKNKALMTPRHKIWTPDAETLILQNSVFHEADKVGDDGTALREASLGRKLGFQHWMAQNMSQVDSQTATQTANINAGNLTKGSTVLTVDAASVDDWAGKWIEINGKVYHVVSDTVGTGTGNITLEYGLVEDIADDDVVTGVNSDALLTAAFAAGFDKELTLDNGSGSSPTTLPQVGQLVTFGTATERYTVVQVDPTNDTIVLDRPLEVAVSNNDAVNYGVEGGGYNFAFHPNTLTLAIRPLAPPREGTGAVAGIADMAGVTMRVVVSYDGEKQGTLVTLDFLAGIKVLDTDLGAICLS